MVTIDRKVSRSLLRLTRNYNDEIFFSPENGRFILVHNASTSEKSVPFPVPSSEILPSLDRLADAGMIRYTVKVWGNDRYFCITAMLLHAKAFWWDRFSKRFICGFFSGVAVGIAANILTPFIQQALVRLTALIQSLL